MHGKVVEQGRRLGYRRGRMRSRCIVVVAWTLVLGCSDGGGTDDTALEPSTSASTTAAAETSFTGASSTAAADTSTLTAADASTTTEAETSADATTDDSSESTTGDSDPVDHGIDIGEHNTGVPPGTRLTPMEGTVVLDTPGEIWEGIDLTGTISVTADDVTIRNCRIHSTSFFAISNEGSNLLVEHCEIFGDLDSYTGVAGSNMTLRRNDIHGFENPVVASSNVIVEECYIHDLSYAPGAHPDGVEWGGSGNDSIVRRNRIMIGGDTGCVNVTPYGGGTANDNVIEDNLFSGGTYSLYIRGDGGGTVSGVTVTGNIWIEGSYAYGTHSVVDVTDVTWSGNTLEDGTDVPL